MNIAPILLDNPVLTREMRRRMRGKAMIYSLITYVGVLCVVTFFILLIMSTSLLRLSGGNVGELFDEMIKVGQVVFTGMVIIQCIIVLIMAPAITASLITAERERGTADFLRVTTLPPTHFIVGAFFSTTLYVILLLGCALPIVSITMLFGGRAPGEILLVFGALLVGSIVLSSLGIYTSSIRHKTRNAQGAMIVIAIAFVFIAVNTLNIINGMREILVIQSRDPFGWEDYSFFWTTIPDWLFVGIIPLIFSFFMLVVAGRKVYNVQNRPLNYLQFLVVTILIFGALLALTWTAPASQAIATLNVWFIISLFVLLLAALTLCIHYVDVGGENWRIHQRLPILAVIDDSILFMLLFIAGWWLAGKWCLETIGIQHGLFSIYAWAIAPPFIFLGVVGRLLAHRFYHRHIVFRLMLGGVVICWVVMPLLVQLFSIGRPWESLGGILFFVPWCSLFALAEIYFDPNYPPIMFGDWPGHMASFTYLILAAILYLFLLRKNYAAKRELDDLEEGVDIDAPSHPYADPSMIEN